MKVVTKSPREQLEADEINGQSLKEESEAKEESKKLALMN